MTVKIMLKREEKKEKHLDLMKSRLGTGHFSDAFIYYSFYLDVNKDIERLKAFKDFVLSEKDNTKN